jgi:glucosamine--fructose-6-phosphate aminotransferase (isomerizing)
MECALIACKGYSAADFQHGPKALARPGSVAIVYGGDTADLEAQGCQVIRPPACDTEHPAYEPLSSILFGQCLALAAARQKGLDPDDPQFIRKVTETR